MKKTVLLLVVCILLFGCSEKQKDNQDSLRFKEEYESLNTDREYRAIEIDPDNPFVYATAEDIVRKMENGESFIVYFGANWCPWCRSVIPVFIDTCKSLDIKTVYYVDVRPGNDLTKDIRDEYGKDAEGNIIQVQKGTEGYHRFIELAGNVLDDYQRYDVPTLDGTPYRGAKRVGAPNFIKVENGKAVSMVLGIPESMDDAYMKLTDEIVNDIRKIFEGFLSE